MPPEGGAQAFAHQRENATKDEELEQLRSATAVPGLPASGGGSERWALKQLGEERRNLYGRSRLRQRCNRRLYGLDEPGQRGGHAHLARSAIVALDAGRARVLRMLMRGRVLERVCMRMSGIVTFVLRLSLRRIVVPAQRHGGGHQSLRRQGEDDQRQHELL